MPKFISVGSGKGGVGKSVLSTNIACLLSRSGLSVTMVDLDAGGADIHILMGLFNPSCTLSDFIEKKVASLDEVTHRLEGFGKISVIPGTGDSLFTANMPAATRSKLLRHIRLIKSDVVIIDIGAGTHFNTLDFFRSADIHICVTTGDPTAILDLYRFIKLAVIRNALSSFLSHDKVSRVIAKSDITSIQELLTIGAEYGDDKRQAILDSIGRFNPMIIFNQVDRAPKARFNRLQSLLQTYLGVPRLELLGGIPEDEMLRKSVRSCHPVASMAPRAASSLALESICERLLGHIRE